MIDAILPSAVRWNQSFTDRVDIDLFPQERAAVAKAVGKRRAEFTTVRACARDALAALGYPSVPLVPGERGAPTWPDGVVGSMTHCAGYRAAAVARGDEVATLGIDAEPNDALPPGVLAALPASAGAACDRVLFSAKESVYKAWFPLARTWLDFQEATLTLVPDGTFTARLLVPGPVVVDRPLQEFSGRWAAGNGFVLTAITVARDA